MLSLDWEHIVDQLDTFEREEELISVPVTGEVLAARVRLAISAGLVDLNKVLKQATVRRNVVVQYIRRQRDVGHPDYRNIDLTRVREAATRLNPTDEPAIPQDLAEFFEHRSSDGHFVKTCSLWSPFSQRGVS